MLERTSILVASIATALVVGYSPLLAERLRGPLAIGVLCLGAASALAIRSGRTRRRAAFAALLLAGLATAAFASLEPAADRDWRPQEARLVRHAIDGDLVELQDVRDFAFGREDSFEERWIEGVWDLRELRGVDLLVSYWPGSRAVAHTMMSFDFGDERALCLSVEARRERGEQWGVLTGLFRNFELVYVLGTERDLVGQRVAQRGERVYLFRTVLTPGEARRLLLAALEAAEALRSAPRFYNTISANCTTTLVGHLNEVWPERTPYAEPILRNGYAPEIALRTGLVKSDLSFDELKAAADVTERAHLAGTAPDFSVQLRARP